MYTRLILFLCAAGLVLGAPRAGRAGEVDRLTEDELTVKAAGLTVNGAGLLAFFQLRTKGEIAPDRLAAFIEGLHSKDGATREKAAAELTAVGPPAIPTLRATARDPDDVEAAALARRCLEALEGNSAEVAAAEVRLIAQRRPDGAVAALLAYLPYAEAPSVQDEVKAALTALAYRDGKADPVLLQALTDESPLRRATAVDVLCQNGFAPPPAALRQLLADPKPTVQLRAALALAQARDAEAVDLLIELIGKLPARQGRDAEEYLINLADEEAPKDVLTDDASREKVRAAWSAWWESTAGTASLEAFTKRTLTEADREKVKSLIHRLGDASFDVRQQAETDLRNMGELAAPMLKNVANDPDPEISQNARYVLQEIEKDAPAPLSPAAARVVALRKPPGAAEALLAYLPFCDDEGLLGEVQSALDATAFSDGKPAPVLVRALADKAEIRRGAAAEALCLGPLGDNLPAVKNLLTDPSPAVQLQTALALAGGPHDRDAVPVLIGLIGERRLNSDQAASAEEYLSRLAANHGPAKLPPGEGAREKRRDLWADWWKTNSNRVALVDRYPPASASRYFGYTLLIQPNNNQIAELGPDGKERMQMTGLTNPQDAVALPDDHYLVAEFNLSRVTERNAKGEVLWTKSLPPAANGQNLFPQSAQRLPNGDTFIVCRNQLSECSRDGKDVFVIPRPNNDILTAAKLRNNEIVVISSIMVQRLDTSGKELKSFRFPVNQQTWTLGNDILPNGNVLVAFQNPPNLVVEFNPDGKEIWSSTAVQNPLAVARSPNGATLIIGQTFPNQQMIELDKNNKQVHTWNLPANTMTNRIHRR